MKYLTAEEIAVALNIHPWAVEDLETTGLMSRMEVGSYDQRSRVWSLNDGRALNAIDQMRHSQEFEDVLRMLRPLWLTIEALSINFELAREHALRFYEMLLSVLEHDKLKSGL